MFNKNIKYFFVASLMVIFNNCQTYNYGYGPGNSINSLLIIVNKGEVELKIYSEINENKNVDNDDYKNIAPWSLLFAFMDAIFDELDTEKLSAGQQLTYYLKRNEIVTLKFIPIRDNENSENPEIIIKYGGKERKYILKNKIAFSRSFSYIGSLN